MEIFKKVGESARTIGGGISEGAKSIGKKSSDLVGVAKLKIEVGKLEKEIENNMFALGKYVYMQYNGEEGHEEEIERLVNSTRILEEEIADIQAQIDKFYPKTPVCSECDTELPSGANYCFMCGNKVEQDGATE
ncbi:MAG: zinc ribbon domain-containing protein [Desulfotomaculaceae bacterium]|nr:zinc ribbon domain-containing protein [Desulfotomaculaceae bacterium]